MIHLGETRRRIALPTACNWTDRLNKTKEARERHKREIATCIFVAKQQVTGRDEAKKAKEEDKLA